VHFLFLGGTRFIGHTAASEAVFRGHDVTLVHRGQHRMEVMGARELLVDRGDPGALARAVTLARPDVVVDTRAMSKSDAEASALALGIAGVRGVILSSQDVFASWGALLGYDAPPRQDELDESSALMTVRFPYRGKGHDGGEDYDKKDVEAVFRAAAGAKMPAVCVLRLPAVYGRRDYRRRFGAIVDAIDAGVEIPRVGGAEWRWTHAHVRDAAHAIVLAGEQPRPGFSLFNVGERDTPTMAARVEALAGAAGKAIRWREAEKPLEEAFAVLDRAPRDLVVSSRRIREELGYNEVTSEEERLADTVAWARQTRGAAPS
jgi:nucleoside-diphosphate-sugar epimerase